MKWINGTMLVMVIAVNALANILPINGMNTGEISALIPNLFVPSGVTFSIWSVIYIGLIGFVLYPFITGQKIQKSINLLFLVTCILNASWILAWHHLHIGLSLIIMLAFLITLINIFLKLDVKSSLEHWLVSVPLTLYFAWICVATIANVTAVLVYYEIDIPYPVFMTILMIGATQVLVWIVNSRKTNWTYSAVIIWALIGILIKRMSAEILYYEIIIAAGFGIILTLSITIYQQRNHSILSNPV